MSLHLGVWRVVGCWSMSQEARKADLRYSTEDEFDHKMWSTDEVVLSGALARTPSSSSSHEIFSSLNPILPRRASLLPATVQRFPRVSCPRKLILTRHVIPRLFATRLFDPIHAHVYVPTCPHTPSMRVVVRARRCPHPLPPCSRRTASPGQARAGSCPRTM